MKAAAHPSQRQLRAGEAASWGGPAKPKLKVLAWKPMPRNTLAGFAKVRYGSLVLIDCAVHRHPGGRCWVALPAKPLLDQAGQHKRDVNGKAQYVPFAEWPDRATSDRFSELVIGQLRQRFPGALDGQADS